MPNKPSAREYNFMKTMVKYSDSDYPEFWTIPVVGTFLIMFGVLFGPFMGWPLLLIPITIAGFWTLIKYQNKAYDMIAKYGVYTKIHEELKQEKEANNG